MMVIATGSIPLIAVHCFYNGYVEKQPVAGKELLCRVLVRRTPGEHGLSNITEIMLKMALNTIQSINQSINKTICRLQNQ